MSDLAERLRKRVSEQGVYEMRSLTELVPIEHLAADEIERLTARVAELEEQVATYWKTIQNLSEGVEPRLKGARQKALEDARVAIYRKVKAEDSLGRSPQDSLDESRKHDLRAGAFEEAMRVIDLLRQETNHE